MGLFKWSILGVFAVLVVVALLELQNRSSKASLVLEEEDAKRLAQFQLSSAKAEQEEELLVQKQKELEIVPVESEETKSSSTTPLQDQSPEQTPPLPRQHSAERAAKKRANKLSSTSGTSSYVRLGASREKFLVLGFEILCFVLVLFPTLQL